MARDPGAARRVSGQVARRAFSVRMVGEVIGELRRVTWPTREETVRLTIIVIAVSVAVGAFLGVVDIGFSRLMSLALDSSEPSVEVF